jgi:sugar phosphate isomerase/epimerase
VELREVPGGGGHYMRQSEQQLKDYLKQLRDNGIGRVLSEHSHVQDHAAGYRASVRRPETPEGREKRIARHQAEFERRKADFEQAFRAAHALDVDQIRVFTFLRTAEPASLNQRIADVIGEMADMAAKEKIKLLVENEAACNVVTCAEMAAFIKLLPEKTVGLNWDPHNGRALKEVPFPDGYKVLPVKRVGNVQMKGHSLLDPEQKLDWAGIFSALARDGYKGQVGLETHYFDGTKIEKSHMSMVEIWADSRVVNEES